MKLHLSKIFKQMSVSLQKYEGRYRIYVDTRTFHKLYESSFDSRLHRHYAISDYQESIFPCERDLGGPEGIRVIYIARRRFQDQPNLWARSQ